MLGARKMPEPIMPPMMMAVAAAPPSPRSSTPFVTGQYKQGRRHWVPHVALCLFELSAIAMSDPTGKGDFHGDIDAVRRSNAEDPHRKIYEGPRAVKPVGA